MTPNVFTKVPVGQLPSNNFNMPYDFKLSLQMGYLVPIALRECIPGDRWKVNSSIMARMAPMIAPVMHNVNIKTYHFFVPNRLVWRNWEKFITAGVPTEETPAAPYFSNVSFEHGSLGDYLGAPTNYNGDTPIPVDKISALPFAAYQKVWDDYFRDQNLIPEAHDFLQDGLNTNSSYRDLRQKAWEHDYFTSALPFAQKGEPVSIPLGTTAPVVQTNPGFADLYVNTATNLPPNPSIDAYINMPTGALGNPGGSMSVRLADGQYQADLTDATAVTINALRYAVRLQEFLEKNARGGTRYIENILMHFGVHSSDKRLQRPEFLGSGSQNMVISEVLQNSESENTPQGNMAGHGISAGSGKDISYFCEEHGYIISLVCVLPRTAYQQGLHRHFTRFSPLDYAWPTFAHLGEQEILKRELLYSGTSTDDDTFGYTPRFSEYKYMNSRVAGDFKSSLAFWHMGRIFSSVPSLNASFITADPTTRIFAVEGTTDKIYMWVIFHEKVRRVLPVFGIPTL